MADKQKAGGACLCGKVTFSADQVAINVGACHCSMCRKWGGGPLLAVDCGTDVSFQSESSVKAFDSSEWAERGFCKECGTHLFYRIKQTGQHIMPADLFDNLTGVFMDHQIFIDEKPDYYDFSNQTHDMTGAQVFAQFSGSSP